MSIHSVLARTVRSMLSTPLLWLYGLLAALMGWNTLPLTFVVDGMRSPDAFLGRGPTGAVLLGLIALVALALEVLSIRALAAVPVGGAFARIPTVIGFFVAMGITTMLIAIAVVFSLTWLFSTLAGAISNFLTLNLATILVLALMSLSLLLPLWALTPLGERAAVLSDGGAWDAVFASMALFDEAIGASLLALVASLGLDLGLLALGAALGARDLSAPGLLGILSAWHGDNVIVGCLLLPLGALVAMFKAAVWTAIYVEVAPRIQDELTLTRAPGAQPVSARRWLSALAAQSRRALHALLHAPALLVFAALIAFVGLPGPADLLTLYRLIPTPALSPNLLVFLSAVPGGGAMLFILYPVAVILTTMLSAALIVGTRQALGVQSAPGMNALSEGLSRWWQLLLAKVVLALSGGLLGLVVMVGGLFALAALVAVVPGFDPLGDYWTTFVAVMAVLFILLFLPVVARVVLFEDVTGTDAVLRAIDVLFARPLLALLLFVFTFGLDVLKGPMATLFGLLTNGWAILLALFVGRSPDTPITLGQWLASLALFLVATVLIAFKALIWTEFYGHAAARAESETSGAEPARTYSQRKRRTGG